MAFDNPEADQDADAVYNQIWEDLVVEIYDV